MDNRLKYIGEHLEEMLISPDEKFRFHCTQCGKCCINREDILLNPKDLYNIAATLSISQEEAVERYCETYMGLGLRGCLSCGSGRRAASKSLPVAEGSKVHGS